MVVLVFWIAGTSLSYGRPARKPSTTRSKFEISPSISLDSRMYSKPLACRPFCCRGRLEKSWAGIVGQLGSSGAIGSDGVGFPGERSAGKRVSDHTSNSVSSGPSGRIRYDEALL